MLGIKFNGLISFETPEAGRLLSLYIKVLVHWS